MAKLLFDVIKTRKSIRSYSDEPIEDEVLNKIQNYIDNVTNPFNKKIYIEIVKTNNSLKDKLGTYGVVKNPKYFLVAYCEDKSFCLEALGYTLEKVILHCTSLGLGTVWLGGTFSRNKFSKAVNLKSNYIIPAISPFGYPGDKKTSIGKIFEKTNSKKQPFSSLFFKNDFLIPMTKLQAGIYGDALEAVRLAPSSLNNQPWRVVLNDEGLHFFTTKTKSINKIDMGIAFCHLDVVLKEQRVTGTFKILNPEINTDLKYVISWVPDKYFL